MKKVCEGDVVLVEYSARAADGDNGVVASQNGRMRLRAGNHGAVGRIDVAVVGMCAGQKTDLVVCPEDAFGVRDPSLVRRLSRSRFSSYPNLKAGCLLRLHSKSGREVEVVTREVSDRTVTVDANHPLAGMTLMIELTVLDIEPSGE
jgi:FKBP-type peptidyl-prolyl cis-trans isomerase 2